MRVLQIHSRYREYGGEERVVENDAALLREAGHEVLTHEVPNPTGGLAAAASLAASSWNVRQAQRVGRLIAEWQPDLVHIHNTWFSLSPSVIRAVKSRGVPSVLTLHNYRLSCVSANHFRNGQPCFDCLGRIPVKGVSRKCYRDSAIASGAVAMAVGTGELAHAWRLPDVVSVPSKYLAGLVSRSGHVDTSRVEVMPHWTPDPGFAGNMPSSSHDIAFIGRTAPEKGLRLLVEAWRSVHDRLGDLRLNIFSPTPIGLDPELESIGILDASRAERETREAILSSRAVLVPSVWEEPFGMVAIEAFAAGRPAIGTAVGGLPETIGHLDARCLVSHPTVDEWGNALLRLVDGFWVDDLGRRARELFQERFSPSAGIGRLMEAYEKAINRSSGSEVVDAS